MNLWLSNMCTARMIYHPSEIRSLYAGLISLEKHSFRDIDKVKYEKKTSKYLYFVYVIPKIMQILKDFSEATKVEH